MEYLSKEEIREKFMEHLEKTQWCTHDDAVIAASDFPDPYKLPYLNHEYIGKAVIDEEEYEMNAAWTDFSMFRTFSNKPPFRFYVFYRCEDVKDHTVESYLNAKTLYELVPPNEDNDDFPELNDNNPFFF